MKFPLIVCVVLMLGCQQQSVQGTHFRLEMNAQQQVVLFVVRNNEVSYGGGLNAIENKTTWDGSMNSKQRALFDKYISTLDISHGFIQEGVGKYSICIQRGFEENKIVLPLTDSNATNVYDLLLEVAEARFDETLDTLPKPSVDAMLQNRGLGKNK